MTKIIESRRRFKSRLDAKQDVSRPIPALMGDGAGTIEVPNQPGYVYIRVGDGDLGQAFNNRAPLADNLAIDVGYDPITDPDRRIFQVLSVRMADYAGGGNTPYPNLPNHHEMHEFGGGDDVYLSWRRLMGLRVGRPSGYSVTVDEGFILRAGAWLAVLAQTLDLTASKPALATQARYVLITLNSAGVATSTNGALVAVGALDISDCPVPAAGEIPLAAVRMYGTQTSIGDAPSAPDIIDLRFPQTAMTGSVYLADLDGYARGNIIRGGAADWEAYALAGAAGSFLRRDANDVLWSTLTLPNAATVGDILHATGANAIGSLADVAVGSVLVSGGVGAAPSYSASPTLTGLTLSGLTPSTVIYSDAARAITSLANAVGVLTNDGSGGLSWGAAGGAHVILSATHTDTLVDSVVDGDVIIGNVTPKWSRLAIAIPAANVRNVLGIDNGELRPSWKTALDATAPTTIAESAVAAAGTSLIFSHRDHTHGAPATWAPTAHNILSASHGDTTAAALVAGGMLYVDATNKLVQLAAATTDHSTILFSTITNAPYWSEFSLNGTSGGLTNFSVTATKILNLIATNSYDITFPATGTVALLGTANVFTTSQGITLSTNASVNLTVTNANAGASANAGFYAISDTVTASYLAYSAASGGGARLNLVASGGYMIIGTSTNHKIEFYTNNILRATFLAAGGLSLVGKISTYNNVATEGYGVPAIVDDVAITDRGSDIGSTNFTNAGTAGTYRIHMYAYPKTVDGTAGTVTISLAWTDGYGARTADLTTFSLASSNRYLADLMVQIASGSVAYSSTHTGIFGTATFNLYMTCERLS